MLKNETLVLNVKKLTFDFLSLYVFFSYLCCLSLVTDDELLVEKIIHIDRLFCGQMA